MNPLVVAVQALQSIPPQVRRYLLLAYALVVLVVLALEIFNVDLDYDKINGVLAVVGGYLGFQSAANVPPATPAAGGDPDAAGL
jgi:uncharacterized membrane protein